MNIARKRFAHGAGKSHVARPAWRETKSFCATGIDQEWSRCGFSMVLNFPTCNTGAYLDWWQVTSGNFWLLINCHQLSLQVPKDFEILHWIESIEHVMPSITTNLQARAVAEERKWRLRLEHFETTIARTKVRVQRHAGHVETHWALASVEIHESYSCDLPGAWNCMNFTISMGWSKWEAVASPANSAFC